MALFNFKYPNCYARKHSSLKLLRLNNQRPNLCRKSNISLPVASNTKMHSDVLEMNSIVPSINMACTTVPVTIIIANVICINRQICARMRKRLLITAKNAVAKTAHMAITPQTENGVGEAKSRASITSGGLVIQSPPIWTKIEATKNAPTQWWICLALTGERPGKYLPASNG